MSQTEAPLIDRRVYKDLVPKVEGLIQTYTAGVAIQGWQSNPNQLDSGGALVRIFSRLAELVIARLNRLPDQSFLAFLDLIGVRLNPPQAARVPLTFLLAPGSPVDALLPAGTQALAVALEGETEPPQFETERDLVVTRSQLVAVYSRDENDFWADFTKIATGQTAGTFKPFTGELRIDHNLYLSHSLFGLPEKKTIGLKIISTATSTFWRSAVTWSFWNGKDWEPLAPTTAEDVSVQLSSATGFTARQVNGLDGFWLRGQLKDPLASGGDEPSINSLSAIVTIDHKDILTVPEWSFANQTPLDLSKDAFPFGEKPRIGDTFYLANDESLSKPDTVVDLHIGLANPLDPDDTAARDAISGLVLIWEFWDGGAWHVLGGSGPGGADSADNSKAKFSDTTNGFLYEGTIQFTVPKIALREVNGEVHHWLRVRIARGSYGVDAQYVPQVDQQGQTAYTLVPSTLRPPSLRSVLLGYLYASSGEASERIVVVTENDFTSAEVMSFPFKPFVRFEEKHTALYLGFERPGETIGFANRTTALFFRVSESLYNAATEPKAVTEEASVFWEYWNGSWERLGTSDETHQLTSSGLVTFIGPPDFKRSTSFGREAFWLRGRWVSGQYAVEPQLDRVLINTMWAAHAQTIQGEVLGSSRGERGQVFRTLKAPVLDAPVLEVIEPDIPSGDDLTALEAEEGDDAVAVVRDSVGQPVEIRVRWHEVPDLYESEPRSRHYVFDPLSGEVRFGDGIRGLVPPPGRNNVRMARYRTGGGLAGNRPAGSIARLKSTVPYIAGVIQSVPAEGGAAEESLEAACSRGPKKLRHRDRAVAAADFEDLAFEASSGVARAYAMPAQDSSERGQVGLIIVPASDAAQPEPGLELLARVRSYIEERISPVVDFWVAGPDWLQLNVQAEVVLQPLENSTVVQAAARDRLRAFLHPLSGGPEGQGWELGRKPHRSDFYALIEETPGVDHLLWLKIDEELSEGGGRPERSLVFSGNHSINVRSDVDETAGAPGSLS